MHKAVSESDRTELAELVRRLSVVHGRVTLSSTLPEGTGKAVQGAGVKVAFDASGRRLLAWTGFDGGHFSVHTGEVSGAANGANLTIHDSVSNDGFLKAIGGTLVVDGAITGAGSAVIGEGGTLDLGGADAQADLRSRQTDAVGRIHGFEHVIAELGEVVVGLVFNDF